MKNIPKKFTIDRSKWRCGGFGEHQGGEGQTQLLNKEGFMCCLGQISEQCGVPREHLKENNGPQVIPLNVTMEGRVDRESPFLMTLGFLVTLRRKVNRTLAGSVTGRRLAPDCTLLATKAMKLNDVRELSYESREEALKRLFAEHGYELEFTGEYDRWSKYQRNSP